MTVATTVSPAAGRGAPSGAVREESPHRESVPGSIRLTAAPKAAAQRVGTMIEAIYTGDTGINASQQFLDVTSNNLANLNTTSFKANQVRFEDLVYNTLSAAGAN